MSLKSQIRAKIAEFDRRSPSVLGETEAEFGSHRGYMAALVDLAADADPPVSSGSTWLIKSHLETGGHLSRSQTARLLAHLDLVTEWDAQLHICQSVRLLTLGLAQAGALAAWVTPLLSHSRPFVRAWSLDAMCRIGAVHAEFRTLAKDALASALDDGSASVRARARRLADDFKELNG